eukprot:TRINITY_DN7679_c0_g1_i1.p1 TRINITY_DN7679_c0_g1~~TRINITY_DN7679_c0_g1_i1.p1  ORF type:complete len:154 (+),score=25.31 TRINITY_DN7679_c0_g1_i1:28-462(+)
MSRWILCVFAVYLLAPLSGAQYMTFEMVAKDGGVEATADAFPRGPLYFTFNNAAASQYPVEVDCEGKPPVKGCIVGLGDLNSTASGERVQQIAKVAPGSGQRVTIAMCSTELWFDFTLTFQVPTQGWSTEVPIQCRGGSLHRSS